MDMSVHQSGSNDQITDVQCGSRVVVDADNPTLCDVNGGRVLTVWQDDSRTADDQLRILCNLCALAVNCGFRVSKMNPLLVFRRRCRFR